MHTCWYRKEPNACAPAWMNGFYHHSETTRSPQCMCGGLSLQCVFGVAPGTLRCCSRSRRTAWHIHLVSKEHCCEHHGCEDVFLFIHWNSNLNIEALIANPLYPRMYKLPHSNISSQTDGRFGGCACVWCSSELCWKMHALYLLATHGYLWRPTARAAYASVSTEQWPRRVFVYGIRMKLRVESAHHNIEDKLRRFSFVLETTAAWLAAMHSLVWPNTRGHGSRHSCYASWKGESETMHHMIKHTFRNLLHRSAHKMRVIYIHIYLSFQFTHHSRVCTFSHEHTNEQKCERTICAYLTQSHSRKTMQIRTMQTRTHVTLPNSMHHPYALANAWHWHIYEYAYVSERGWGGGLLVPSGRIPTHLHRPGDLVRPHQTSAHRQRAVPFADIINCCSAMLLLCMLFRWFQNADSTPTISIAQHYNFKCKRSAAPFTHTQACLNVLLCPFTVPGMCVRLVPGPRACTGQRRATEQIMTYSAPARQALVSTLRA